MSKQNKYEEIEAYLEDKLGAQERSDFEKKLANDSELANELNLHRKVHNDIGDSTKRELRGVLGDMRKQYAQVEKRDNIRQLKPQRNLYRVLSIAASVLILGMAYWYFILDNSEDNQPIVEEVIEPVEETKPSDNQIDTPKEPIPTDPSNLAQNEEPKPPIAPEKTNPTIEKPNLPDVPQFDPFEVNPSLEELVASSESTPFEFEMELPAQDVKMTLRNDKVLFGVLGTLFTSKFPEDDNFVVQIFNNQPDTYTNNQPVFRLEMNFDKQENEKDISFAGEARDIYYFSMRENLTIEPGLYYWIIALDKGETVAASGKMTINPE